MKDPKLSIIGGLKLNAINNPYRLLELVSSHENENVSRAALEKLLNLKELVDDRKIILICCVVKDTKYESVARHAFSYCSKANIPDDMKARIIKCWLNKIKFGSVRKEAKNWLKKHGY